MKEEYISVSEFAKRAGVSRQAIYNRLSSDLSIYYKVVDNKKTLNIKGLELFSVKQTVKVDNQLDNEIIDLLRQELQAKDKQIEDLTRMLEQAQELLSQQQKLQAIAEKRLEIEEKPPERAENLDLEALKRRIPTSPSIFSPRKTKVEWLTKYTAINEEFTDEEKAFLRKNGVPSPEEMRAYYKLEIPD